MGLVDTFIKGATALVTGEPFGGLSGKKQDEKWWEDSWERIERRMKLILPSDRAKFCIFCGSFIEDRNVREMHVQMEHSDLASGDAEFCIFCGDHVGGLGEERTRHYNRTHPLGIHRSNA